MKASQVLRTYKGFWDPVNNTSVVYDDYLNLTSVCDASAYKGHAYQIFTKDSLPMYMFNDVNSLVTFTQAEQDLCDFRRRLLLNMFKDNGLKSRSMMNISNLKYGGYNDYCRRTC